MRNQGNDTFEILFNNGLVLSLLGWLVAFTFGIIIVRPIVDNLFREIDESESLYRDVSLEIYQKEYKKKNEVLIGNSFNNLNKRQIIMNIYSVSKKVILIRLCISLVIVLALTMV